MQAAHLLADLLASPELPRVSVLGTSSGGLASLRLAQHYPERVGDQVQLDSAGPGWGAAWGVRLTTRKRLEPMALWPVRRFLAEPI